MSEARILGPSNSSFLYAGFYADYKERFLWGSVFFSSLILLTGYFFWSFGKPLTFFSFLRSFFLSSLVSFLFYQFLRVNLCPVLQIYKNEIIISEFKKFAVPVSSISELRIQGPKVHLSFLENGVVRKIELLILPMNMNRKITINDGKIYQSW